MRAQTMNTELKKHTTKTKRPPGFANRVDWEPCIVTILGKRLQNSRRPSNPTQPRRVSRNSAWRFLSPAPWSRVRAAPDVLLLSSSFSLAVGCLPTIDRLVRSDTQSQTRAPAGSDRRVGLTVQRILLEWTSDTAFLAPFTVTGLLAISLSYSTRHGIKAE
jgi:hypothetical protein